MLSASSWCSFCLFWLSLFLIIIVLVMATLSFLDFFTWKRWLEFVFGGIVGTGSGDQKEEDQVLNDDQPLTNYDNIKPGGSKSDLISSKKSSKSSPTSASTIRSSKLEDDHLLMFSYQDFGKVEEKTLVVHQGEYTTSDSETNISNCDLLTEHSVETCTGSKKSEGDSSCRSRKEISEIDVLNKQPHGHNKSFIKWVPFKDCALPSRYDSYLDRDDSPRGVVAWEVASHTYLPRSRSNVIIGDDISPTVPVRLTISDSVLGSVPFQHMSTSKNINYSKQFSQRIRCDSGRFEYQRNRRFISTLIREGVSMKATLYLQIPAKQETSRCILTCNFSFKFSYFSARIIVNRCNMKTDLILVLLKSFLWPWEDVNVTWVPSLLTWLITILTADNAIPIFKNQIIRSNYKAVLLLSKEAARQVRHQDLVFLYNLAMLLQTSPDHVLLLQQLN
uniref:Uncharacterized protein n=1 Tax=Strigamia maritima TaxID=126957 RepID=T1JB18_STRMM